MSKNIWFNQGLALLADIFEVIKAVGDGDITIICSHSQKEFVGRNNCDFFFTEPTELTDDEYLEYCLSFAQQNNIDLLVPSRFKTLLVNNRERFAAIGVTLLVAGDAQTLVTIEDKTTCYEALGQGLVPMPEYRKFTNLKSFDKAYKELSAKHDKVCFKPAKGVFAHGFRVVAPDGTAFERLMHSGPYTATSSLGLAETRIIFSERETFETFMLMQYLGGRERSVDCIASQGKIVRSIIRLKDSHNSQLIEENSYIGELIERIVSKLNLGGVFNVQFKEHEGVPYLLEINSRMSGGLPKACLAAEFPLPYWAIRLALGSTTISNIPQPKSGARLRKDKVYAIETVSH